MINTETVSRIVFSIDAMAKAKHITARHDLDTLVGIATRALAEGNSEIQALECARRYANAIKESGDAMDRLLADILSLEALQLQAL